MFEWKSGIFVITRNERIGYHGNCIISPPTLGWVPLGTTPICWLLS